MTAMTALLLTDHLRTMFSIACIHRSQGESLPSFLETAASTLLMVRPAEQKLSLYLVVSKLLRKTVFHGNRSEIWNELSLLCDGEKLAGAGGGQCGNVATFV